ncbi:unnamed protein product [Durusdinium trenchii]|uniref:Uncharacterized protein n=2 Tax=Durusdinium trenchii TaxID=1381693 RepID=A0ABP0RAZ0_9DINO
MTAPCLAAKRRSNMTFGLKAWRRCAASLLVLLSIAPANFLFESEGRQSALRWGRRQSVLWTSMLCAEEAHAIGVALDYRKLEEIDLSSRKIVGDINSEKVQKLRVSLKPNRRDWKEPVPRCWLPQLAILQALGTIKDAKQKTEALFRAYREDVTVSFKPYLTPIPEMREALEELYELFDPDSKRDVERIGRLLLSARYKFNEARSADPKATDYELMVSNSVLLSDKKEKAKFDTYLQNFLQIADKFLLFIE